MSEKRKEGEKNLTVSFRLPEQAYYEMRLRVSEGETSTFIRDAVLEKLSRTPRPDKILALEDRLRKVEDSFAEMKKLLADLVTLTPQEWKVNPYKFCIDDLDRKILEVLLQEKGATTPELAEKFGEDRWVILTRLKRLQKRSSKELGRSIIDYFGGEKYGKKKAWWVVEELLEP